MWFLSSYIFEMVGCRSNEIAVANVIQDSQSPTPWTVWNWSYRYTFVFHSPSQSMRDEIQNCFESSREFAELKHFVKFEWLRIMSNVSKGMRPYHQVRNKVTFRDNLQYKANRFVIPRPLKKRLSNVVALNRSLIVNEGEWMAKILCIICSYTGHAQKKTGRDMCTSHLW